MTLQSSWDLSGRDVVPDLRAAARPADVGAAILYAMLQANGESWAAPYDAVRAKLQIRSKSVAPELQEQADSRFRTYKALFRGLGLLLDDGGHLESTQLGVRLLASLEQQYQAVDDFGRVVSTGARRDIALTVAPALARYQLANPSAGAEYPAGSDIRPLLAIWRAMRQLDNKLHWEELGRTLTKCLRDDDVPGAVAKIQSARLDDRYDPKSPAVMTELLGPREPDMGDNQSDRLDTWFSRAGFKDLFLEARDRSDGYRYLSSEFIDIVDSHVAAPPAFNSTPDASEYFRWLGQSPALQSSPIAASTDVLDFTILQRARRHGARQIIALVGPAGTGKTSAAQRAAFTLAEGDLSRVSTVQFHAGFTYEEFVGGLAPEGGKFVPTPGVLVEICDRALADPHHTYVLVIDEFSRADIANVLGELLTYIEYRHRPFRVPVLNRDVEVPSNLVIIATLNPQDRSVVNLDDALVRRLRQIAVESSPVALTEILSESGMESALRAQVVSWFKGLPAGTPFGHGVFTGVRDEDDLRDLWRESLQYFLRRGGVTVYPDAERVERDYVWNRPFAAAPLAAVATVVPAADDDS